MPYQKFTYRLLVACVLSLLFAAGPAANFAYAEVATADEARQVCENKLFVYVSQHGSWGGSANPVVVAESAILSDGNVVAYYYEIAPDGFVVVPTLKSVSPVKAYSDVGSIDLEGGGPIDILRRDMFRAQEVFVEEFGSLDFVPALESCLPFDRVCREMWTDYTLPTDQFSVIQPLVTQAEPAGIAANSGVALLTSRWHQGAPYNNLCPIGDTACTNTNCSISTDRTVVGCTATACAQIMYYHEWPPAGVEDTRYTWDGDDSCDNTGTSSTLSVTLSDGYDWDSMADEVFASSSSAARNAVAELCYEVGVAMEMDYGVCASGAHPSADAFTDLFLYEDGIERENRSDHTAEEWFDIVVDEIDADRPMVVVIYWVENEITVGHTIVCDGWQTVGESDEYHMNYGWGNHPATMWYTVDQVETTSEYLLRGIEPRDDLGAVSYVIDRSGSMAGLPLAVAKFAANLGITFTGMGSELSVVSFSSSAGTNYPTTFFASDDDRANARAAVNSLSANGGTSIGAGMIQGCEELSQSLSESRDYIVLSDGRQNTAPSPEDALNGSCFQSLNLMQELLDLDSDFRTPVHTIAFGTAADQALLSSIAARTGGLFLYVPSRSEPLELADLYLTIQGNISGAQRTGEFVNSIAAPAIDTHQFQVGPDMMDQAVTLVWDDGADNLDLVLEDPNGTQIDANNAESVGVEFVCGPGIEYFTVPSPEAGMWTARIVAVTGETTYALVLSGQSSITLNVELDREEYGPNSTITVLAELNEADTPITGATITAEVMTPTASMVDYLSATVDPAAADPGILPMDLHLSADGAQYVDDSGTVMYAASEIVFQDDGNHGDGASGDGVYGGQFADTAVLGTYTFDVHANGVSPSGTDFSRDASLAAVVTATANAAPEADAGEDRIVECSGHDSTPVELNGSGSQDPDGDALTYTWTSNGEVIAGPTSENTAEVVLTTSVHTIELLVEDGAGGEDTDTVILTVVDTTPPVINVAASREALWPPNHRLVRIDFEIDVEDVCDDSPEVILLSATSSEPDESGVAGDFPEDIQDADIGTLDTSLQVRSERIGFDSGRIYEVVYRATDSAGNSSTATIEILVPESTNHIGQVLSEGEGEPYEAKEVSYLVSGASLWKTRIPGRIAIDGEGQEPSVETIEPQSANMSNTAGVVTPTAFFVGDWTGDDVSDALVTFDIQELEALSEASDSLDGDPVFVVEVPAGHFVLLEMDKVGTTSIGLSDLVKKLREEAGLDEQIADEDSGTPTILRSMLTGVAPNPFNPNTTIFFQTRAAGPVQVAVFDISGRLLCQLVDETMDAGEHSVVWKGTDSSGRRAASGVYFCRLVTGEVVDSRRMILLK